MSSEAAAQQVAREERTPAQQQVEDDRLFEIHRRSKNAARKARKYPNATASPPAKGKQEAQETRETRETKEAREAREVREAQQVRKAQEAQEAREAQQVREAQEVQEKKFVGVKKITVDETRRSKHSSRGAWFEGRRRKDDEPKESKRRPMPEERKRDDRPMWAIQKEALKAKFPEGWMPRKRLSPDALSGIRALNRQFPEIYTTSALSQKFEVSPEAIRRVLRSKWEPADEQDENREQRWYRRGLRIWERYAELGKTPPKKWQDAGVQPRSWEEDEEGDDEEHRANEERLRRLRTQVKLAKSLM